MQKKAFLPSNHPFVCQAQSKKSLLCRRSCQTDVVDKEKLEGAIPQDRGGMAPGTVWTFSPQQKSLHQGDCHKVFNSNDFMEWWKEQLLPNLHQPSIVIMDNAKYHCAYPDDVPKGKNARKKDWQECLRSRQVPFDEQ